MLNGHGIHRTAIYRRDLRALPLLPGTAQQHRLGAAFSLVHQSCFLLLRIAALITFEFLAELDIDRTRGAATWTTYMGIVGIEQVANILRRCTRCERSAQ